MVRRPARRLRSACSRVRGSWLWRFGGVEAVERSGSPQAPDRDGQKPPWRAEGLPGTSGNGRPKINWWRFVITLLVVYAAFFVVSSFFDSGQTETISYTQFINQVNANN